MSEPNRTRRRKVLRSLPGTREAVGRPPKATAWEDLPSLRAEHPLVAGFKDAKPHAWAILLEGCRPKNPLNTGQGRTISGLVWRSQERKKLRQWAFLATLSKVPVSERRLWDRLIILIVRVFPNESHRMDGDGWQAAAKPIRDGIADALGVADNDPCLEWRYIQEKGAPKEYGVQVLVWRPSTNEAGD